MSNITDWIEPLRPSNCILVLILQKIKRYIFATLQNFIKIIEMKSDLRSFNTHWSLTKWKIWYSYLIAHSYINRGNSIEHIGYYMFYGNSLSTYFPCTKLQIKIIHLHIRKPFEYIKLIILKNCILPRIIEHHWSLNTWIIFVIWERICSPPKRKSEINKYSLCSI